MPNKAKSNLTSVYNIVNPPIVQQYKDNQLNIPFDINYDLDNGGLTGLTGTEMINTNEVNIINITIDNFNNTQPYHLRVYYNDNNDIQGICNCPIHCSTREKHSICTKITISVFRPGSIIIIGARKLMHLMSEQDKILEVLKNNMEYVKGIDNEDDNKQIAILNKEFRKISKKPRLFFIKKEQIVY